jgi:hypothetical protein
MFFYFLFSIYLLIFVNSLIFLLFNSNGFLIQPMFLAETLTLSLQVCSTGSRNNQSLNRSLWGKKRRERAIFRSIIVAHNGVITLGRNS